MNDIDIGAIIKVEELKISFFVSEIEWHDGEIKNMTLIRIKFEDK